jgi:hypothetical protein
MACLDGRLDVGKPLLLWSWRRRARVVVLARHGDEETLALRPDPQGEVQSVSLSAHGAVTAVPPSRR